MGVENVLGEGADADIVQILYRKRTHASVIVGTPGPGSHV